jgi:glycosyltransferase involved in cell wall biosynthesis
VATQTTSSRDKAGLADSDPEVSVVMPCLNEAETLGLCIEMAVTAIRSASLRGEVIVADNGSTDGSQVIAQRLGARVVDVPVRGYGSALRGGILASRAPYIIMGDADGSYDFSTIPVFVDKLRQGYDLVVGNRFRGGIAKGAMPFLHRWIGNPVLTFIGRLFFKSPAGDFHCGLRAIRRDVCLRMNLQTTGMEFASEMIIVASLQNLRVAEVPVVLLPDCRSQKSHLRTWRDGWRHLRFMLLYSPKWLYAVPGSLMIIAGLSGLVWLATGPKQIGSITFDGNTLLVAGLVAILGYQVLVFAVFTRAFATREGLYPESQWLRTLHRLITLEVGLLVGAALIIIGLVMLIIAVISWQRANFGHLNVTVTVEQVIPGCVVVVLGNQTIFSSFFLSILGLRRVADSDLSS